MSDGEKEMNEEELKRTIRDAIHQAHDECHRLLDCPLGDKQQEVVELLCELLDLPDGFSNSVSWDCGQLLPWDRKELGRQWEAKLAWRCE